MKNIVITCKLFDADAQYFIDPLIESNQIDKLLLFRDKSPNIKSEIWYRKGIGIYNQQKIKFLYRFFGMLWKKNVDVFIGIYEIPHGLIALIVAILRQKQAVVSIIGNPKYGFRNNGLRGFVTNWIYKKANVITVTGSQSKQFLIEQKKTDKQKIFVLPNSVPIEEFISNKDKQKKYDLVTIGRLSPEKGLLNLLDIVNKLKYIIPNIKIGIAGKGPQMQEINAKVKELDLKAHIDLLGYVESVSEFLNSGKIFITTSFTEGLPRTAIQSMLGGLPVVASNVGDMSDLVVDGKTGSLIEDPYDKDGFVQGILSILNDDTIYNEYSRNAVIHAQKHYSHTAATKTWNEIFHYLEIKKQT